MQGQSDPGRELLDAQALVGHLLPADTVHGFLAEHRRRLLPDEMFADLFGSGRGRPSVPADVVATVLVLQALEGLSDREALRALVTDLRWKVAAGLSLDDEGFHPTVLTLWRKKLRASESLIRRVRKAIPAAAAAALDGDNYDNGDKPACAWDEISILLAVDGAGWVCRPGGRTHSAGSPESGPRSDLLRYAKFVRIASPRDFALLGAPTA